METKPQVSQVDRFPIGGMREAENDGFAGYSMIEESRELLRTGILQNPLISPSLPPEKESYAAKIRFVGHAKPAISIPWRFGESIACLKALEAIMVGGLLEQKYGVEAQELEINVDHAQLFIMSAFLTSVMVNDRDIMARNPDPELTRVFPTCDIYRAAATPYRYSACNIYSTKDNRYFCAHGSMNPSIIMQALDLPEDRMGDFEESASYWQDRFSRQSVEELEDMVDKTKQAGTVCQTIDEYRNSEQGRANAHCGLWETHHHANSSQLPGWWPSVSQTSPGRPLAGLKVVDLTRVIAAPAITRGLAELGASVMRITAPHLQDLGNLHPDLGWGKWTCALDFRLPSDLACARKLIYEADVVVTGYRPGVLDKYGLGQDGILALTRDCPRGIVLVRENCYGWHGPLASRSGWQQISDAHTGVSFEFGRAMGNEEPVTPVFPNSDYCTGVVGVCGALDALLQRAVKGGSYTVDVALNYYNQWLTGCVGRYPDAVWQALWKRNGGCVVRHQWSMARSIPLYVSMLDRSANYLFDPDFFEVREARASGVQVTTVKPVLRWVSGIVTPGFNVGARRNGFDRPKWPDDLMCEVVN